MLVFSTPQYFFLLLILPLLFVYQNFRKRNRGALLFSHSVWSGNIFKTTQHNVNFFKLLSTILLYIGILSIIISLAGPSVVGGETNYLSKGIDIIIVLDESPSMSAKDFPPINRFESAKDIIQKFIDGRENDSVGIVSFADDAVLRVPLTLDYETVKSSVKNLKIMSMGQGTAIGMGLAVSVLHLKNSTSTSKVIILLTDGVNNAGEVLPESAAKAAKELGIKVYTIGIGGVDPVEIEFVNPETGIVTKADLPAGGFDQTLLEEIAAITGGNFYKASSPGMLETVLQGIDYLETSKKIIETRIKSRPIYDLFIIISFFSLIGYFILRKGVLGEIL
ncbi:VWA domain-containing protein [Thiospirochaeta perfilievii]|uniref:VWA domain-containing protein n=1 Tax=Thiospirochaeta perfilievii TaxID=252967 RepID=A0A5C1QD65_9SPIO|nr:VWA domain-containing protein [Thiospirochaeta perfilievii]QEN05010.1 VWA domain-containing protein [Thiospirochaeta perfilievii]